MTGYGLTGTTCATLQATETHMELHPFGITGTLFIPAESEEEAKEIANGIVASLNVDLGKIVSKDNTSALGASVALGNASRSMPLTPGVVEKLAKQMDLGLKVA